MATYITLADFTDQGIKNVKDSPKRAQAFRDAAKKAGCTVKDMYWTVGSHDLIVIVDAPDAETATALLLSVGALGNVRTETLRGFSAEEMGEIIGKIP